MEKLIYDLNSIIFEENNQIVKINKTSNYKQYNTSISELNFNYILNNKNYTLQQSITILNSISFYNIKSKTNIFRYENALYRYDNITFYFEKALGNLLKLEKYDNDIRDNVIFQLIEGLNYIQSKGIIHRDIKPENILVFIDDKQLKIKYCDFETCIFNNIFVTIFNKSTIIAPEASHESKFIKNSYKSDIFSLGLTIYVFLYPYNDDFYNNNDYYSSLPGWTLKKHIKLFNLTEHVCKLLKISTNEYENDTDNILEKYGYRIKSSLKLYNFELLINTNDKDLDDLINKMIQFDYEERIDMNGILNHKFFENYKFTKYEKDKPIINVCSNDNKLKEFFKLSDFFKLNNNISDGLLISIIELVIRYINLNDYKEYDFYILMYVMYKYYNYDFDEYIKNIPNFYKLVFEREIELLKLFGYIIRSKLFIDDIIDGKYINIEFFNYIKEYNFQDKSLKDCYEDFIN